MRRLPNAIHFHTEMGNSRNALTSGSRQKRQPGANARRLMIQGRWHWRPVHGCLENRTLARAGCFGFSHKRARSFSPVCLPE